MNKNNYILGIHYGHDATAALFKDGVCIEAMSEERLSRQKKHAGFPFLSIQYIKDKYTISKFDNVCIVGEDLKRGDVIFNTKNDNEILRSKNKNSLPFYNRSLGFKFPLLGRLIALRDYLLEKKIYSKKTERKVLGFIESQFEGSCIEFIHHHDAHAWACVPFIEQDKERLIFTLDGAGDDASGSVSKYSKGNMKLIMRIPWRHSLGLLYCAMVDLLGMSRNEHEFKVMGLAPYAKEKYGDIFYQELKEILFFNKDTGKFVAKINTDKITSFFYMKQTTIRYRFDSIAFGIQKLTEELMSQFIQWYCEKFKIYNIGVAGGVFMNVKSNQKIREMDSIKSMVITPSGGDESLAIGAAAYLHSKLFGYKSIKRLENIYLGSEYTNQEIKTAIDQYDFIKENCTIRYFESEKDSIEKEVAALLSENNVVGRFKGRAEWGARALGNRSILANPSSVDNVKLINEMIKNRDFWMPFATSILYEDRENYLVDSKNRFDPYMAITYNTKELAQEHLIAALHPYDLTSRPQMVSESYNKDYWNLIKHFKDITGIGGVLNTSFNLHGEPNVENPYDALRTFHLSGMKYLAIGDYLISKK